MSAPASRHIREYGAPRELTSEEAHKFRRLDQPAAATFTAMDGPAFEAVTTRSHLALLLGPFQQAGPSEQGDPGRTGLALNQLGTLAALRRRDRQHQARGQAARRAERCDRRRRRGP